MSLLENLKPKFWDHHDVASGHFKHMFNFRRVWKYAVLITGSFALFPLIFVTIIDYQVTQKAIESEMFLRTSKFLSNTRRTIAFFLTERRFALNFILQDNSYEQLKDNKRLENLLENLKKGLSGVSDIGVVDQDGIQRAYVGPYDLIGIDYSNQSWFKEVVNRGVYISDVFLGFRNVPHLVIAIRHKSDTDKFYVLRASIETDRFNELISQLEFFEYGDPFIINQQGVLQVSAKNQGNILDKIYLPLPKNSEDANVYETKDKNGETFIVGYAYINDTPFILMVVSEKKLVMKSWYSTRLQLIAFLIVSITVILVVVLSVCTYLVSNIYTVDQRRVVALHKAEYSNKLASLGRLAAGVAHEINNPLAVINEKAGLIKDIFTFSQTYTNDPKLIKLIDSVLSSVERCATITRRLLSFARHMDVTVQPLHIGDVIRDVLGFLDKEAQYRSIKISIEIAEDIPQFESDRGKLQQIFLNLFNNAFAALADGGHLAITAKMKDQEKVIITVADNGCGISSDDLKRVFEPFFTTKTKQGGTGLGLSITYSLVIELGGNIYVNSEIARGTMFTITLPLKRPEKKGDIHETNQSIACG